MRIVAFTLSADPPGAPPRLGAALPDGETVVDLQAGHFSMRERPHPLLRDPETFREGADAAEQAARRVVEWVVSQRPPGTTVAIEHLAAVRELR